MNIFKDVSCPWEKTFACISQANAAVVALKERSTHSIFKIADTSTNRGLLHTERPLRPDGSFRAQPLLRSSVGDAFKHRWACPDPSLLFTDNLRRDMELTSKESYGAQVEASLTQQPRDDQQRNQSKRDGSPWCRQDTGSIDKDAPNE